MRWLASTLALVQPATPTPVESWSSTDRRQLAQLWTCSEEEDEDGEPADGVLE
jgi:hypothetical protein